MNKRLVKKKLKKKEQFKGIVYGEGNNGGDTLLIESLSDGNLYIRSGSCCIFNIDAKVPVEFLTAMIAEKMLKCDNDINKVIDSFSWDKEFSDKLKNSIVNKHT